jgi:hypothetical protein
VRRRRFERRGRPRLANAKRRQTTVAGRRGVPVIDRGTNELRSRKRRLTTREDLEVNAVGILYGEA